MTGALDARHVSVRFGGVLACDGIDLRLDPGEVVGLTGPNGSGKSTFLNAVSGLVDASGEIRVNGDPLPLGAPAHVARRGVARTFQTAQTWTALSCLENVLLGARDHRHHGLAGALLQRSRMLRVERDRWREAAGALERCGLGDQARRPAAALTYGQRRMLELARTIVGHPEILLLDEPAAGLNEEETAFLAQALAALGADGTSILVVDHKIDFLDRLCDRIVVLSLGKVIADAAPEEVWQDEGVIDAYLGSSRGRRRGDA